MIDEDATFDRDRLKTRLDGAVRTLKSDFGGLRMGRASVALLDNVMVPAYGGTMPLPQLGAVNAPEARLLVVQVWDRSLVTTVEKALRDSGLGLNPNTEGQTIRLPIPELTGERRVELCKIVRKTTEAARVAVRHVRRDSIEVIKKQQKASMMSDDEAKAWSSEISTMTTATIATIDRLAEGKEKDVMGEKE